MSTAFEHQMKRVLGDWFAPENPSARCPHCKQHHQEPQLVLMALANWPCVRAAKYQKEVFDRCLTGEPYNVRRRRFERLAPFYRKGAWLGHESDADYLARMRQLKFNPPDWELLIHVDEAGGPKHAKKRRSRAAPGRSVRGGRTRTAEKPRQHKNRSTDKRKLGER